MQDHQHSTQEDGRVGQVESGPMTACIVQPEEEGQAGITGIVIPVDEVGYLSIQDSIRHVADGTPQHKGQAGGQELFSRFQVFQPEQDDDAECNRERGEKPALPAPCFAEETECSPFIKGQQEVEMG